MTPFSATALTEFAHAILGRAGVPDENARLVADSLIAANLRGVDSHGVQMLLPYLDQLRAGTMDPCAEGRPVLETGACLIYDGQNGLGQVVADRCVAHASRLARGCGVALVTARESNHFGAAAYWGEKLAAAGCIGIVMTNASPAAPPWQGIEPRIGTNPICMAVPGSESGGWLLDMATTTVAFGKVYDASHRNQTTIPVGWATDADGVPTTDTETALRGLPTPLGGYKGSGLGLLVELLTSGLSGGPMATDVGSLRYGFERLGVSHCFLAIDMARFCPPGEFRRRLDHLTRMIKSSRPAAGYDEVLVAGEPEWRVAEGRKRDGIPLPRKLIADLAARAEAMAVSFPRSL
jgi:LDH2 family malate/lactate/ureidoglycolate dehydrogenase